MLTNPIHKTILTKLKNEVKAVLEASKADYANFPLRGGQILTMVLKRI